MRASRLLRILLALQNRGRLTTLQLATELEVARRTIMRDIDALTEAGLPIVVHRGNAGGIELGFNYRSRFVGLDAKEAEALGVLLALPHSALADLELSSAAQSARDKLVESMPELVRKRIQQAQDRFQFADSPPRQIDARVAAFNNRPDWLRYIARPNQRDALQLMLADWFRLGIITERAGPATGGFPPVLLVETGAAFTGVLIDNGIAISMDGKGAWRDNVFVERLWRSVKYEEVYLRAYDSVTEARASIGRYLDFYNRRRPHSSLDDTTPDHAYFTPLPLRLAA